MLLFLACVFANDDDDNDDEPPAKCVDTKDDHGKDPNCKGQLSFCTTSSYMVKYCCASCKKCEDAKPSNCVSVTPAPKPSESCKEDGDTLAKPFNCKKNKKQCLTGFNCKNKKSCQTKHAPKGSFMFQHCCKTCTECYANSTPGKPGSGCAPAPKTEPKASTYTLNDKCMQAGSKMRRRADCSTCKDNKFNYKGATHCSRYLYNCVKPKGPAATATAKGYYAFMVDNCCASCKKCLAAGTCWSTPAPTSKEGPTEWQRAIMENVLNPAVDGVAGVLADAALDWARGKFNKEVEPERPEHGHHPEPTPPHPNPHPAPSPDPHHHHPSGPDGPDGPDRPPDGPHHPPAINPFNPDGPDGPDGPHHPSREPGHHPDIDPNHPDGPHHPSHEPAVHPEHHPHHHGGFGR